MDLTSINKIGEYLIKQREFINTNSRILATIKQVNEDFTIPVTKGYTKEYSSVSNYLDGVKNVHYLLDLLDDIVSALVVFKVHSINNTVFFLYNTKNSLMSCHMEKMITSAKDINGNPRFIYEILSSGNSYSMIFIVEDNIEGAEILDEIRDFINYELKKRFYNPDTSEVPIEPTVNEQQQDVTATET